MFRETNRGKRIVRQNRSNACARDYRTNQAFVTTNTGYARGKGTITADNTMDWGGGIYILRFVRLFVERDLLVAVRF